MRTVSVCLSMGAVGACAEGDVPEASDASPPLLSARATGNPRAPGDPGDQWLPSPESVFDAEVGSSDASTSGSQSPQVAPDAGADPAAPDAGADPAAPGEAPLEDAGAPSPPVPMSGPPSAPACPVESCNGLDDDCNGAIDDGAACPCETLTRAGMPYLVCSTTMGWFAARNLCHSVGYDLAVVDDAGEDADLLQEVNRRGLGNTWLGLNDHLAEGHWVWLDGQPLIYSHWDSGEPNNGGDGEDCGVLMTDEGRRSEWDDRDCDSARPFLCELSAAP